MWQNKHDTEESNPNLWFTAIEVVKEDTFLEKYLNYIFDSFRIFSY